MQLLVLILNKTECLNEILSQFVQNNVKGATILDSRGMAHSLAEYDELRFFSSLRRVLDPDHKESKTILAVVSEEQISVVSEIVNRVIGGLDKPDTGVIFTLPVNYVEGIGNAQ